MNITDFLEARIAEDETECTPMASMDDDDRGGWAIHYAERVLAECAAKRTIISEHEPVDFSGLGMESPNACRICGVDKNMHDWEWLDNSFPCPTIRALAAVYADHPDYQQEWAA